MLFAETDVILLAIIGLIQAVVLAIIGLVKIWLEIKTKCSVDTNTAVTKQAIDNNTVAVSTAADQAALQQYRAAEKVATVAKVAEGAAEKVATVAKVLEEFKNGHGLPPPDSGV